MNYLGFDQEKVADTVNELNDLLCNYQLYYQNLRKYHWNIKGQNFFELHEQFENLYNDARLKIDDIAERILTLRQSPISDWSKYLEKSTIEEAKDTEGDREMVLTLLDNHRILIEKMRAVIATADKANDEGTIDMIGGFLETIEKKSWMLDAWAEQKHNVVLN